MAGRLYAAKIVKDAYGTNVYPHVKDVHKKMVKDKIMYDGFMKAFSDDEYDQINAMLNHQKDFDLGVNRDATYIYGPSRPRTIFVGLKIGTDLL